MGSIPDLFKSLNKLKMWASIQRSDTNLHSGGLLSPGWVAINNNERLWLLEVSKELTGLNWEIGTLLSKN